MNPDSLFDTDQPQQTLAMTVRLEGRGVFTGRDCAITLEPAAEGTGLWFVSPGRDGVHRAIPVDAAHLESDPNRTSLVSADDPTARVTLVEHVLSACHGLGIDNLTMVVEGGECPLGDGSALLYVEAMLAAGIAAQSARRRLLRITESFTIHEDDKRLTLSPSEEPGLHLQYFLEYAHPLIGHQEIHGTLTPDFYATRVAPARTFIPIEEAERLVHAGVLKASEEADCLVVYPERTNHPLRLADEFAVHKLLDLIGDLRLCGFPVWGTVVGEKSGHALNHQAARWLAAAAPRRSSDRSPGV